jgi:predicted transcriptional regulator
MMTTTIRVSMRTHSIIQELASESGASMQELVEQAIESFRRQRILAEANAAYAALRTDPLAWEEWKTEEAAWDVTLNDGLEEA